MEVLLPIDYLHPDIYQRRNCEIYPIIEKKIEQFRVMDWTPQKIEENMRHIQLLRNERHNNPHKRISCAKSKNRIITKSRAEAKKQNMLKEETIQAMEEINNLAKNKMEDAPPTKKIRFYLGQRILWHLHHKIP